MKALDILGCSLDYIVCITGLLKFPFLLSKVSTNVSSCSFDFMSLLLSLPLIEYRSLILFVCLFIMHFLGYTLLRLPISSLFYAKRGLDKTLLIFSICAVRRRGKSQ